MVSSMPSSTSFFNASWQKRDTQEWKSASHLQSLTSVRNCFPHISYLTLQVNELDADNAPFHPKVIRATHTQEVLGEQGRRIRELTSLIQKRFKFPENSVSLYAAKVQNRGLSAVAQCESLRYKLLNGLAVRRACYGVLRFIMESGAKGCEVVVSGKLRAARAKSMKFTVCIAFA